MSSIPLIQLPQPIPESYVKCVKVTGNSNVFAVDYDPTLYEVVPHNAFLLPLHSISRVLHFGIDLSNRMPYLSLQASDIPCYGWDGRDHKVFWMSRMLWTGVLNKVWIPVSPAKTLPVTGRIVPPSGAIPDDGQFVLAGRPTVTMGASSSGSTSRKHQN